MASEVQKKFAAESMKGKPVTELAGIGKQLGEKLSKKEIKQASTVLGHFLVMEMNEEKFKKWLMETCGAQPHQQQACYNCLKEWCEQHL